MRNAPSVSYPVGRSAFHGQVLLALGLTGTLALGLLWGLMPALHLGGLAAGAAALLAWAVFVARDWWCTPAGCLRWDARAGAQPPQQAQGRWLWQVGEAAPRELGRVEWVLDAQSVLLLRLHKAGERSRWVWLEAVRDPARWGDLRRALTAHT